MARKALIPAPDAPEIVSWLAAKKKAEAAEAALKAARKDLEAVLPPGTEVPDDYPVLWQESQRVVVEDITALPDDLTSLVPDTKKIHAYAVLNGEYPAGVDFESSYALKARQAKK